jgi:hypothetical protein
MGQLPEDVLADLDSLSVVYQFDFQSWMTPTRIPPG